MHGKLLWFNSEKNFGFIRTEHGDRLYVHRSGFVGDQAPVGRCAGLDVTFDVVGAEDADDRAAVSVSVTHEADPRRARMRRTGMRSSS
jgi:cold shock CspA family protein